jgi:hypothetical protein
MKIRDMIGPQIIPTGGTVESLTKLEFDQVLIIASQVEAALNENDEWGALAILRAFDIGIEGKLAVWAQFDSKTRARLKKIKEQELTGDTWIEE